jgi:tripartite-type tricarboxylate transporter receptor subunit TctC
VTHAENLAASRPYYPAKPARIIEPFGAGGGPDLLARALAPELSALGGQLVTVQNIPGAGATAGPAQVAKSPADDATAGVATIADSLRSAPNNGIEIEASSTMTAAMVCSVSRNAKSAMDARGEVFSTATNW